MKKIMLLMALALTCTVATAQPNGGGRMSPEERKQRTEQRRQQRNTELREKLALSEAVAVKVDSVNKKYDAQQDELFASASQGSDRQAMRTRMESITSACTAEVKLHLTAEQQAKYDAYLKEKAKEQEQQRANRGGGGGNR
ncbi:MAG: hypothetical protein LBS94_00720 [Prevotellaceae bacterium]|jgi:hypothetical protein|nr:hypothetical protein [Prevotellaceae bacterium]